MLIGILMTTFVILFIILMTKMSTTSHNYFQPLIGSNKCTWGPSYWCASKENAQECNLTWDDCQKYITQPPPSLSQLPPNQS